MPNKKLNFKYIKPNNFKTSLINGAIGGITHQGLLDIKFYVETHAHPEQTELEINEEGFLVNDNTNKPDYSIRSIEFEALIDEHTTRAVYEWLGKKLEEFKKIKGEVKDHG